jgi:4-hydroxythreonine-4-phosphate dehydrogenase
MTVIERITPASDLPLAITSGDPAGVGPDVTLMAWLRRRDLGLAAFYVIADPAMLADRAALLKLDVPIKSIAPGEAAATFQSALPVVDCGLSAKPVPGSPSAANAAAIIASIERGVGDVLAGRARAVITNPIAKHVLYDAGFQHPGHTEFLGELALQWGPPPAFDFGLDFGRAGVYRPVMMLAGPDLRTVPVTVHTSLLTAIGMLSADLIVETARIVSADLAAKFKLSSPRLAVAGLNPHAGEQGAMGREDIDIIAPAIARLRAEGIDAVGPLPADTLFHAEARSRYDVALCMYHDQALIPVKTLAFDETVNVTLGLPFVRTSPDHGTAFDIAGSGSARPNSLCAAISLADRLARVSEPARGL